MSVLFNNAKEGHIERQRSRIPHLIIIATICYSTSILSSELLAQTGVIQGDVTVAGSITSEPIKNLQVDVYDFSVQASPLAFGFTDDLGQYTVSGLPAGDYKVYFNTWNLNYLPEWYDNADDFNTAKKVTVTAGSTTMSINAALIKGCVIQGTVTDQKTNFVIAGIPIFVYEISTEQWIPSAGTDANGQYIVSGLSSGNYIVEFGWQNSLNYVVKYYDNQVDFNNATPVTVSMGKATKGINAQLSKSVTIYFPLMLRL